MRRGEISQCERAARVKGRRSDLLRKVVVSREVTQHPNGFVERAIFIVFTETVLLQEIIAEDTRNLFKDSSKPALVQHQKS
jgi:hypothetical protein